MTPASKTWQRKVADLAGHPKRGWLARVRRVLRDHLKGRQPSPRAIRYWMDRGDSPHDEQQVIQALADGFKVPVSWLTNGRDEPKPVIGRDATAAFVRIVEESGMSPGAKAIALALTDAGAVDFLEAQLRVYRDSVAPRLPGGSPR